jgi:hypothetical protein
MAHAVAVRVVNITNRVTLLPDSDYTVNWPSRIVTVLNGAASGDIVSIEVYGIGGGSQLYKESYPGNLVGNSLVVPVAYNEIYEFNIVVNGEIISNYTYASSSGGRTTTLTFVDTYDSSDWVVVTALGITTPQKTWSFPVTQYFVYDGSTTTYTLNNSLQGTNDINLIVEREGNRLRPAESVEYIADGSSAAPYYLPTRGKVNQGLISDNDVEVYVDQQRLFLAVDYTVSAWDGSSDRYVEFNTAPVAGARIVIALTTDADYLINGNQLILRVGAAFGAVIGVTTWNDTQEQGLLTQVFVGPTESGVTVGEPYDSTTFDAGSVTGDPGSYDYSAGTVIATNDFDTGRPILDTERLWVTLNGWRLMAGNGYTVSGSVVTVSGSIIGPGDVLVITSFTQTVVPEALAFRIFQDMLGIQKMYRILPETSTVLTQPLSATDDIIYVRNAKNLDEPDLNNNIFGQLTINGERITYRERDDWGNTVSGLRRGTAGTGADSHSVDAAVLSIGRGELLPTQYQQNILEQTYLADGTTTTFNAEFGYVNEIDVYLGGSIQCYVGATIGTLVEIPQEDFTIISVDPITVQLNFVPNAGQQFRVTYTPISGPVSTLTVPTTGATSRWAAPFSATDLVLQSDTAYDVTDLNPITVVFDSVIPPKRVVVINDLNSNTFFITQADVATDTFITDISVTRPIQVRVGGTSVSQSEYSVSNVNPITITFNQAPQDGVEVTIFIIQAEVLYAQGPNTASDGIPLQEQNTEAAWFIQGRV